MRLLSSKQYNDEIEKGWEWINRKHPNIIKSIKNRMYGINPYKCFFGNLLKKSFEKNFPYLTLKWDENQKQTIIVFK